MIASAGRAAALALLGVCGPAAGYVDHPLPGHDGGPGRPNCRECHLHAAAKAERGTLELAGLPARYAPGRTYTLTLTVGHPDLKRAGFQASVQAADGGPSSGAGRWVADNERVEVAADEAGTAYVQHAPAGATTDHPGRAAWSFIWQAPDRAVGPVLISIAANAANGDESALGDVILLRRIVVDAPAP